MPRPHRWESIHHFAQGAWKRPLRRQKAVAADPEQANCRRPILSHKARVDKRLVAVER